MNLTTLSGKFEALKSLGFNTPFNKTVASREEAHELFQQISDSRENLDHEIDGVVFSVDNISDMRNMGIASGDKLKPNGQIACKFAPKGAYVTIKEIIWSQDGGQYATPVGIYESTYLDGANCTNVSLKSLEWMEKNKIGVGSVVYCVRSGGCIPTIPDDFPNWKLSESTDFRTPTKCQYCEGSMIRVGARISCDNEDCLAKQAHRIAHFLSSFGVRGLDVKSLRSYTEAGIRLGDFFEDNAVSQIRSKISTFNAAGGKISIKVWDKIVKQLYL